MSLEALIPCGEQLLVKRDPPELRCGELVIPATSTLGVTTSGVVVKVGPRALGFTEGDRVIFGILAGRALAREGVSSEEEYRLLPASDVQCKIAPGRLLREALAESYSRAIAASRSAQEGYWGNDAAP